MEKTIAKNKTNKQPITVTVTVSKELGGVETAKHLIELGACKR
ncbi:hypothetical protein [Oceanobacillus sojae]|nr:hypothetical protein [Oceanobacillus sojae]